MKAVVIVLLFALLLIPSMAFAVEIQNGNMESVSAKSTNYCAKFNYVGCQASTQDFYKPNIWNTWFGKWDFGQSWTDAHSGSWSTALWYQPPSECRWDENTSSCGAVSQGREGSLLQHDVSFQISGASISFWAKKCPFTPVQCVGWRGATGCDGDQYYGTYNGTNTGTFAFAIADVNVSNVSTVYPFSAGDVWQKYSVVPPINVSHVYDIYWQTLSLETGQQNPNCILLDDFVVDYGQELVSPAEAYISDMTTKTGFPFTILSRGLVYSPSGYMGTSDIAVSKGFATVPLASVVLGYAVNFPATWNKVCPTTKEIYLQYTDGRELRITDFNKLSESSCTHTSCGYGGCYYGYSERYTFPLLNYTNLNRTAIYTNYGWNNFTFDGNLGVRSTYTSPLTGYETINGANDLYPVVIYKNLIATNGSYQFHAYNFKPTESSTSNMVFNLLSSNGTVVDTSGGTYSFPTGDSVWINDDFSGELATSADINVTFKSNPSLTYKSNTFTLFPLTGSGTACFSRCLPDGSGTYEDAHYQGAGCVRNYFPNYTTCVAPPTPVTPPNTVFNTSTTEPVSFINQTAVIESGWGWTLPLATPFFILTMFMLVIVGVLAYLTKSPEVAVGSLLLLMLAFTFLGIYPIWIGIIFSIIAGLILAKMMGIIGGG
jgi:hypothetical protein